MNIFCFNLLFLHDEFPNNINANKMDDKPINEELKALISLLDEPDEVILEQIQQKIFSYGADAVPYLEKAWENSFDSILQSRIEEIIHKIQFDNVYMELNNWYHFGARNLYLGYLLLTKFQYPDLNEDTIKSQIDALAQDVWLELNDNLTFLEKIRVINHILFEVHGFSANTANFHSPQNSYINTLLETKKGNPLSLGILYIIIAQKNNLPVFGVNLPEHFVLAFTNQFPENNLSFIKENEVLFYINPFNKGAVFTKKEIDMFIKQLKLKPNQSYYNPTENEEIIKRLLNNLIHSYEKLGYTNKVMELELLLNIFKDEEESD
jgi:regulator of sirC expression with transglutaminase-like and TPR domain